MATTKRTKRPSYRSSLEALVKILLKGSKIDAVYEDTKLPYTVSAVYNPDFRLPKLGPYKNVLIEVKGHFSSQDRKKMRAVLEQHPDVILVMVFGRSKNKLNKKSHTTYSDWCEKHGILYCDVKDFENGDITKFLLSILSKRRTGKSLIPRKKNFKASLPSARV